MRLDKKRLGMIDLQPLCRECGCQEHYDMVCWNLDCTCANHRFGGKCDGTIPVTQTTDHTGNFLEVKIDNP